MGSVFAWALALSLRRRILWCVGIAVFVMVWVDVGLTGPEGRYRLGHWPVGLDAPLFWQGGVESGSMYSQAWVRVDGKVPKARAHLPVIGWL